MSVQTRRRPSSSSFKAPSITSSLFLNQVSHSHHSLSSLSFFSCSRFSRFNLGSSKPHLPSYSIGCIFSADIMTGKAKPKKHTAKEIAAKVDAATTNRGGGKAGLADRSGIEKGGHAKFECPHCKTTAPDLKSMQIHHDARHPKIPFEEAKLANLHTTHAPESSKPKPGVRGSLKK